MEISRSLHALISTDNLLDFWTFVWIAIIADKHFCKRATVNVAVSDKEYLMASAQAYLEQHNIWR